MTYEIAELRVITIMLNWAAKGPWNVPWNNGRPPPLNQQGGGGCGTRLPRTEKKIYFLRVPFFAVFAAARKALAVGAPLVPGLRIFSGFLPAAFCALIRRRFAAMFAYSPFRGITSS